MPKDEWKKARDIEHAKRAKFELAAGLPPSYERPWETESDGLVSAVVPPSFEAGYPTLPSIVRMWLEELRGPEKEAKAAHERLRKLGPEHAEAVPVLIDALRHPVAVVRRMATKTLVQIRKPAVPFLCRLIQSGTEQERECAVECLAGIGVSASNDVMRLMNSDKPSVRNDAIKAAGMGAVPSSFLWNMLVTGNEHHRRVARIAFLASGSQSVPFLLECLRRERIDRRLAAASVLGELGEEASGALPVLAELARSARDYRIKTAASQAWTAIRQAKKKKHGADRAAAPPPRKSSSRQKMPLKDTKRFPGKAPMQKRPPRKSK